jgi:uncharacterized Fe-S cluster-containing protein
MAYYNTNQEKGEELKQSWKKTEKQEALILRHFRNNPKVYFSPEMIQEAVLEKAPLTSVRRAITNLTTQGKLRKTDIMVKGKYGKRIHTWKVIMNYEQGILELKIKVE